MNTLAGARVQIGIRFSSVKKPYRSSAEAWKVAVTVTFVVFVGFASGFLGWMGAGLDEDDVASFALLEPATGVPVRLGSVLTVRSLPCVSIIATGNSANLASRATGRRDLARAKTELTSGLLAVEHFHSY
jgi:hypothetical protein